MDISNKKSRIDLTAYFKKNSIPTEQNFAEFIGATLNQRDDGIYKPPGDPLCIQATDHTHKPVFNFYEAFSDARPSWFVALADGAGNRGFTMGNLSNDANATPIPRFYIQMATGNVGIGTASPSHRLDIAGSLEAESADITGPVHVQSTLDVGGIFTASSTLNARATMTVGDAFTAEKNALVKGALNADSTATIKGALNAQSTATIGDMFTAEKNALVKGALNADSTATIKGALNAQSTATIDGAFNAKSTATITDALAAQSTASVMGAFNAKSTATIDGVLTANNGVTVSAGKTTVGILEARSIGVNSSNADEDLPIAAKGAGNVSLNSPVKATKGLTVTSAGATIGTTTAPQSLTVHGNIEAQSDITVSGAASFAAVNAGGVVKANKGLEVTGGPVTIGTFDANQSVTVFGTVAARNGITVVDGPTSLKDLTAGAATIDGALNAKSTATIDGALNAQSTATVAGILTANADAVVKGALNADSTATVKGALNAQSTATITGLLTANADAVVNGALNAQSTATIGEVLTANKDVVVKGALCGDSTATVKIGTYDANQSLKVHGKVTARKGLTVEEGTTSVTTFEASGMIAAKDGLDVTGGPVTIGTITENQSLTVQGNTTLHGTLTLGGYVTKKVVNEVSATTASIEAIPTEAAVSKYVSQQVLAAKPSTSMNLGTGNDGDLATRKAVIDFVNAAIPIGAILMWSGSAVPTGWALCDGTNGTPNLKDRFVLASGNHNIGTTGGLDKVTLTINEMPKHNHTASTALAGSHSHTIAYRLDSYDYGTNYTEANLKDNSKPGMNETGTKGTSSDGDHSHTVSIGYTGADSSHENMPPYYVLAFIMRKS